LPEWHGEPEGVADEEYGRAAAIGGFYGDCKVVNAPPDELRNARMTIVSVIEVVLGKAIALLGWDI
jgi:arginyl-tRNA synthetase